MSIERLWIEKHRGNLHAPDSWSTGDISLTYCGSGSGFFGQDQMKQYCGLYPAHLHSLHSTQLTRFDNKLETITTVVDEGKGMLVEECILSVYHHEPVDWLVPGVPPCRRQIEVPLTFIVKYEGELLSSAKVQWDQAMLLKQIGAFAKVISGRASDAEEIFNSLPILTSKQACQRLRCPSTLNSCPLNPLSEANRPASKKTVLDGMKSLLTDLPDAPITPARHRKLPALESKVFRDDSCPQTPLQPKRIHASQNSNIHFDDSVQALKPTGARLVDNIFAPCNESEQSVNKDSIKINPNRLESHVFDQDAKFVPSITLDPERLKSHIFDEAPANIEKHGDARTGLVSHIFDADDEVTIVKKNNYNESHFEISNAEPGDEVHKTVPSDRNCDSHFTGASLTNDSAAESYKNIVHLNKNAGHFQGSTFELALDSSAPSVATKPTQNFVFKSSINFGSNDTFEEAPRQTNTKNQSQVCFDGEAEMPKAVPSIRSDPTRGKSQIIF